MILILLILILLQLLIQFLILILLILMILTLVLLTLLTALMLLIAHPQAMMVEEQRFSVLSSNAPEVFVCHFQTSSTRLQCEHGRPGYGPVARGQAWLHGTHCTQ